MRRQFFAALRSPGELRHKGEPGQLEVTFRGRTWESAGPLRIEAHRAEVIISDAEGELIIQFATDELATIWADRLKRAVGDYL